MKPLLITPDTKDRASISIPCLLIFEALRLQGLLDSKLYVNTEFIHGLNDTAQIMSKDFTENLIDNLLRDFTS